MGCHQATTKHKSKSQEFHNLPQNGISNKNHTDQDKNHNNEHNLNGHQEEDIRQNANNSTATNKKTQFSKDVIEHDNENEDNKLIDKTLLQSQGQLPIYNEKNKTIRQKLEIKMIQKQQFHNQNNAYYRSQQKKLTNYLNILWNLHNQNILKFCDYYEDQKNYYMVWLYQPKYQKYIEDKLDYSIFDQQVFESPTPNQNYLKNDQSNSQELSLEISTQIEIHINSQSIKDMFRFQTKIGVGKFGLVMLGEHLKTKEKVAVKILSRKQCEQEIKQNFQITKKKTNPVEKEIKILQKLQNKHIIKLLDVFQDTENYYIVIEYCNDGNLQDRMIKIKSEKQIAEIIKQILEALDYCHSLKIIHRDVKPDNIAFSTITETKQIAVKLIDFGMATVMTKKQYKQKRVGTPYFLSPEVIDKKYNQKSDLWSLGVILYNWVTQDYPFDGQNVTHLLANIFNKNVEPNYKDDKWKKYSDEIVDFTQLLLKKDQVLRMSASEALEHAWIKNNTNIINK